MMNSEEPSPHGLILPDESKAAITEPEPGLLRQVLAYTPAMMLVRHQLREAWRGAAHKHPHEQLVYVISGRIRMVVAGTSFDAAAGDSFIVASNAEHQAAALEDSLVLDVFTPAREDYL
jgi:quercetin dioxygenase-like cupin family protein